MGTIPVPIEFITFDDGGKVENIDMYGFVNSLPRKQKLGYFIRLLGFIQEEQYQGAKKFLGTTQGDGDRFSDVFEAIGRMYYVLHSMEDEYRELCNAL
jgi:hypothetical protein